MSNEELERRIARLERIIEISRSLNSTLNLPPLLELIIRAGRELTNSEASSIMLVDRKTGELHFETATGTRSAEIRSVVVPMEGSVAGWVARNNQALIVHDVYSDPRFHVSQQVDQAIDFATTSLMAVPLAVKGKVIGVLEAVNKLDEERFTEEDLETFSILADQAAIAIENAILFEQSDLVAEIVHEIRTPLTSIVGYADILKRKGLSDEQRQTFAQTIQREAIRLGQLVGDFLDLARLESGRTFLAQEQVNLAQVVREVLEVLEPQAKEAGILLQTERDYPAVVGDQARLKQALINLVANAVKYCRRGDSVTITVQESAETVRVGVVDTGPGIPPEAQARLFQKFYRVPSSEAEAKGSGLGLAITRRIVEAHGGEIWVESEVGQGTAFYFTLPRRPS